MNAYKTGILLTAILAVTIALVPLAATAADEVFKAGAAMRVITPDPLLPVSGGMGKPHPVTAKTDDLTARVLVLEKGGVRTAIVSVDNLGWPMLLGDKSRAKIKGIAPENILIGCTHTHSAPDAYGFPDETGAVGADQKYLEWACDQIADAVNDAVSKLEPAVIRVAVGKAKGKIAYNYYAPQLYDPRCGVIQAIATTGDRKGKAIATLINYATHPEIIGNDKGLLGPDLCGPLYKRIEEKGGGLAVFMNSAQGGMVTADNRDPNGGSEDMEVYAECVRIGNLMADEALRILDDSPVQENPTLYVAALPITFPIDSPIMRAVFMMSPLGATMNPDEGYTSRLNLVNVGSAQIVTIPGEALPNVGFYVKRHMPTGHCFLFGLTNDALGYMMTAVDFQSFERYDYISETCLGEKTADIFCAEALKFIAESPKPDPMPAKK